MKIILREIVTINQVFDGAWISTIPGQNIYIGWKSTNLCISELYILPFVVKDFNACQAEIVHVTPSFSNVY